MPEKVSQGGSSVILLPVQTKMKATSDTEGKQFDGL